MNKKVILILTLCIFCSGCTTFTRKGLHNHEQKIYREGIKIGYIQCLFDKLDEMLKEN